MDSNISDSNFILCVLYKMKSYENGNLMKNNWKQVMDYKKDSNEG